MAIDERARHELYQRLESALGEEATATLMAHLPPVGWADVVTKTDLEHRLSTLENRIVAELHRELAATTRTIVFGLLSAQVALVGLALVLARVIA